MVCKNLPHPNLKLISRLEMLRLNEIVPRNPELLEPQEHTLDTPTTETPSGKSKVKKEAESESESDDSDEYSDGMIEKAVLVRF